MSQTSARNDEQRADGQFKCFETGDGSVVVYDSTEPTAWIESDCAVARTQR